MLTMLALDADHLLALDISYLGATLRSFLRCGSP